MNKAYSKLVFVNNQSPDLDADNLNSISNAIDTIDDRVIALDGKATTDEGNISTLQSNVSTLQSNMTTANTNIATNTADIADLKAKTTNVSVSQTLTSGVEIGKITVDNVPTTLYAPDDSGNTTFKDVTKAEYDALPSSKLTDGIAYMVSGLDPMDAYNIPYKNTTVGNKLDNGGSSGAEFYNITQADYDALPSSKLTDGVAYVITDADDMDAYNMPYKNTTVGDALDGIPRIESGISEIQLVKNGDSSAKQITFAKPFESTPSILITPNGSIEGGGSFWQYLTVSSSEETVNGFYIQVHNLSSGGDGKTYKFSWMAIGH